MERRNNTNNLRSFAMTPPRVREGCVRYANHRVAEVRVYDLDTAPLASRTA